MLLHVALDELNVGGEYVKAVLEEDEFGILEVIQKLKEKYDLREEVEKLSKDFLHGYDDKKGEEDAKEEEDNEEEDEDDDDVFGTRDGDALDELDDLGFDHIVATERERFVFYFVTSRSSKRLVAGEVYQRVFIVRRREDVRDVAAV